MDLYKFSAKIFCEASDEFRLEDLIPVFHRWIQNSELDGVLLIDVADYSHVPDGPGLMLIAHEAHYSMDESGGRLGMVYNRKRPFDGDLAGILTQVCRQALLACQRLEKEPALEGRLSFATDRLLLTAVDRLLAPNTPQTRQALEPAIEQLLDGMYAGSDYTLEYQSDPRELFSVTATASQTAPLDTLLSRLG